MRSRLLRILAVVAVLAAWVALCASGPRREADQGGRGMGGGDGGDRGRDAATVTPAATAAASPRVRYTLNDGWRYAPGPLDGAEAPGFDDGAWERVDLPHTWNATASSDEGADYRRGIGWYRRTLALDPSLAGKRVFLHFEGANQVADVYVNGRAAGRHIGGYTAFAFDITDNVRVGAPNVVAVRVDNRHDDDVPPLNADFTFYGGIYRDVWLVATDPVHITLLDHASPGVFIDTPDLTAERATVRVRGTVVNATARRRRVEVVSRVLDLHGREAATLRSTIVVPAGGSAPFRQLSAPIARPRLWSPAEPNLYRVVTELVTNDATGAGEEGVADRIENPLGFRWLRVTPDSGVFLNGRRLPLIGTNRHQDRAGYGNALPDALHRRDVELVKATGFDFLRLAHYPQDPAVLEAMDALGLAGWEEIPVVNLITTSAAFAENAERMLVEMIRQHYNHPSILFWGYMNEVMLRRPDPLPEGYYERLMALARRLEAVVEAEDPGRATVTAISYGEIDNGTGFQDIPDILGLNLYFGWYYRSLDELGPYLDSLHARHPGRPLMISEYGAGSDERIHAREPRAFDFSTEHQQRFHESHLAQLLARPYLAGTAVWNQFDFGSAHRHDSKPNINQKGLLYYDREPKDLWHYYRARLLDEPVLHIATRDWPVRAGSRAADARHDVVVYSNLEAVELVANGTSLGTRATQNGSARWTVTLAPGVNRLEARGAGDGEGRAVRDGTIVVYEDRTAPFVRRDAPVREVAVNAGGAYQYVDGTGLAWEADRPYEPGSWGHVGGEARLDHHRIAGSVEDALFQATREGARAYRFDLPDGDYDVRLLFAETARRAPGERVFTVRVNGVVAFPALDLAAEAGPYTAVERTVRARAAGGGGVAIDLAGVAGRATISGIAVRRRR